MKYLQKEDSLNEGESFWTIEKGDKTTKLILITINSKLEFDHQVVDQQQDDELYIQKHKDSFIAFWDQRRTRWSNFNGLSELCLLCQPIKQLPLRASKNEKFLTDFMSEKNSTYERTKTTKPESNSKTNPDTESQTLTKFIWHHEFHLIFINYPLNKLYIIKNLFTISIKLISPECTESKLCHFGYVISVMSFQVLLFQNF